MKELLALFVDSFERYANSDGRDAALAYDELADLAGRAKTLLAGNPQ